LTRKFVHTGQEAVSIQHKGARVETSHHKKQIETDEKFFSQRVVPHWNKLPEAVVMAESVNIFKNRLDRYKEWGHLKHTALDKLVFLNTVMSHMTRRMYAYNSTEFLLDLRSL